MFTKIASFAAAAQVIASIAPPAHAGFKLNGLAINGLARNGTFVNGLARNGAAPATVNFTIDGIELPKVSR